jgi:hypothetical protein
MNVIYKALVELTKTLKETAFDSDNVITGVVESSAK